MPDWAMQLLVAGGGLGMVATLIRTSFTAWREDRKAREAAQEALVERLEVRNDALQAKVESLLADAYAHERENNMLRAARLAMDEKLTAVATAMTVALTEATAARARPRDRE